MNMASRLTMVRSPPEEGQADRFRERVGKQVRAYAVDLHEDAESG